MNQPEEFCHEGFQKRVCKLNKLLYGLKQAPKMHQKFNKTIKSLDFQSNNSDKCLYYHLVSNKVIIIYLYVDNMVILGSDLSIVDDVEMEESEKLNLNLDDDDLLDE
ncbi:Retrovirus-related Pol polyprotein from transposon TNT 1-94-like protein [Drosera capensis]